MHTRSYIAIAVVAVALVLGSVACTRDRPEEPVDAWTPSLELTPTATPTPSSVTPTVTPTPSPASQESGNVLQPVIPSLPTATPTSTPETGAEPTLWHWYTVREGDALSVIAERFGTTVEELKRLNNLTDSTIYVGQKLKVPGAADQGEAGTKEYTVQPGDTLFSIAKRFGVDMQELARINNITDPSTIYVGQKLIIPAEATPARELYKVQPGDTLSEIAERFNVSVEALMEANGITDPDELYVGQVLRIP